MTHARAARARRARKTMETLQNVILPNLDVPGDESLYVRLNERAHCELARPRVCVVEGGVLTTDTFYGGLTVNAWKRTSPVNTLVLELEGDGEFVAAIGVSCCKSLLMSTPTRRVSILDRCRRRVRRANRFSVNCFARVSSRKFANILSLESPVRPTYRRVFSFPASAPRRTALI